LPRRNFAAFGGLNFEMSFQLVCIECDSIGVVIEDGELAPPSAIVRCSHCSAVRGTLGELRSLASTDRRDLFDIGLSNRAGAAL
jgi:hypothetical protein